jgi:hypothetical protein
VSKEREGEGEGGKKDNLAAIISPRLAVAI